MTSSAPPTKQSAVVEKTLEAVLALKTAVISGRGLAVLALDIELGICSTVI